MGHWSYLVVNWWHQKIELNLDVYQNKKIKMIRPLFIDWLIESE